MYPKEVKADPGAKNRNCFPRSLLHLLKTEAHQVSHPGDPSGDTEHHFLKARVCIHQGLALEVVLAPKRSVLSAGISQTGHWLLYRGKKTVLGWAGQQNSPHREFSQPFLILSSSIPIQERICHRCLLTDRLGP